MLLCGQSGKLHYTQLVINIMLTILLFTFIVMNFLSSIKYFLYVWKDSNLIPLCVCRYLTIYPCYIYSTVDTHKPQNCHQSPHTLLLKESNFNNTATHLLGWSVSWPTDHISTLSVILTLDTLTPQSWVWRARVSLGTCQPPGPWATSVPPSLSETLLNMRRICIGIGNMQT